VSCGKSPRGWVHGALFQGPPWGPGVARGDLGKTAANADRARSNSAGKTLGGSGADEINHDFPGVALQVLNFNGIAIPVAQLVEER
jgi:hypothetical protein